MRHPAPLEMSIRDREPLLWLNDKWMPFETVGSSQLLSIRDVVAADRNWTRFAGLLQTLFPQLESSAGIIESPLYPGDNLQRELEGSSPRAGRWLIKGDHGLPVAGSIKARGGIYEVLLHAEALAQRYGAIDVGQDPVGLASPEVRRIFGRHRVAVGSTGNLGLSIGIMAAALGLQSTVHMSSDAKAWKKARLRDHGVDVIEHTGDFGAAVSAGRDEACNDPSVYFVDDEKSPHLFLGYSVAALRLVRQLASMAIQVDAKHPLFVYIPCGVGGAPGGITFGLRHMLGDCVHCFFAEPVGAPCMLVRLASDDNGPISLGDIGVALSTDADGLAVGQASEFVAPLVRPLVSGVFTARDDDMFEDLYLIERSQGLRIEPSAAAGFRGPRWLLQTEAGQRYLAEHGLSNRMHDATHILWTTGGAFVPEQEYRDFHERGRRVWADRAIARGTA